MLHSQPTGIHSTFTVSLDVSMKYDKVRFARMFIDQPPPHIARIHPEPKVFGDLRALEMTHGITPVQTYLSILDLFTLIGTW